MNRLRPGLCVVLGAVTLGCAAEDIVARRIDGCDAGCVSNHAPGADARACAETWLPAGDSVCSGATVERFRFGLCLCGEYVSEHSLVVSGFGEAPAVIPGSVGANGSFNATGGVSLTGSLVVAGTQGITTGQSSDLTVGANLSDQGALSGGGSVDVGGDARVGGDIGVGTLRVGGTLTTPPGATVSVTGDTQVPSRANDAVIVEPPCACNAATRPDMAGAIHDARTENDNATAGLDAFDLEGIDGATVLDLPCGRYHLSAISGAGPVTIHAHGRVTVDVDGAIDLNDSLTVDTDGGTVELVVEETVRVGGDLDLGGPGGDARLLIAGQGALPIDGVTRITGVLYAPDSELVAGSELRVRGAALVRRVVTGGPVTVEQNGAVGECPL